MRHHHRQSIRIRGWHYASPGWYFLTFGTWGRRRLLAEVRDRRICLTPAGRVVEASWHAIPTHFPGVTLDAFVVMPDHVHGLLHLDNPRPAAGDGERALWSGHGPPPRSVGAIIGSLKSASSREIRRCWPDAPPRIWHRNYYERLIDTEPMLHIIRRYIALNPPRLIAKFHPPRRAARPG